MEKEDTIIEPSKALNNARILLAEDDKMLAELLTKKLQTEGAHIICVRNGQSVITEMKVNKPDIVVTDILLPDMDGFSIIKTIKSDENLRDVPVVFLSNMQSREDYEKSVSLGAADFIVKAQVILDEIVNRIEKVIEKNHK